MTAVGGLNMQDHFRKFKSNLELDTTFAASISTRHETVRTYLANNHPDFRDSKLIGSLQRQTRIHPGAEHKCDVDILVILGEFQRWVAFGGITPQAALRALHSTVAGSARYGGLNPVEDPPTVTVTYADDVEVQLVPAYIDMIGRDPSGREVGDPGRGYWVAKDGRWEIADYDYEAEWISQQNATSAGYLVPTIKMLKAIKRIYFPTLESFPLEILAAHILPAEVLARMMRRVPICYDELIQAFFEAAPSRLAGAIQIPGSKSQAIVLQPIVSVSLVDTFGRIAAYTGSIDGLTSERAKVEAWAKLCGDHFPMTII